MELEALTLTRPSLEDVYLDLVAEQPTQEGLGAVHPMGRS